VTTWGSVAAMLDMLKPAIGRLFPRIRDYSRIRYGFRSRHGYAPNILFPKTFSEKVPHRKLFDRNPNFPSRVDKIAVKEFVAAKLGPAWITPTIWCGDALPPRAERNWPMPFVLKANHGSVMNIFVRSDSERDWDRIETLCEKWLMETYGEWGGEWVYSKIKPRLLVEPFIGGIADLPIDYKLWTFDGRVEFIQVDIDRETDHKRNMYDRNWLHLPFTMGGYPTDPRDIAKPASLELMIEAAATLSEKTPFVRTDFYEVNGCPLFGEMTYYPDSGWEPFKPAEYDLTVGALWP